MESMRILEDPSYVVPPVPADCPPGTVGWLRASVARFAEGAAHARRRELAVALLTGIPPESLGEAAAAWGPGEQWGGVRAGGSQAAVGSACGPPVGAASGPASGPAVGSAVGSASRVGDERLAVDVLAAALGLTVDVYPLVSAVAAVYQPHAGEDPRADAAVAALVDVFGGACDEATAARIGLLVQACDATAGLIREARTGVAPAEAAPVPATRRVSPADGSTVLVPLAAAGLPFGAGRHGCPARAHALAIAEGALSRTAPHEPAGGVGEVSSGGVGVASSVVAGGVGRE